MKLRPFECSNAQDHRDTVRIWNQACGSAFTISEKLVAYNTSGTSVNTIGQIAYEGEHPIGFVLASHRPGDEMGFIDAIAVEPMRQRCGTGSALMEWAETWLKEQGVSRMILGGSYRPFAPGLPVELNSKPFFARRAFRGHPTGDTYDVAHDLSDYHYEVPPFREGEQVRPLQDGEQDALLEFLQREFSDRWHFEVRDYLLSGGNPDEFIVVWTRNGVEAFAWTTTEDSLRPIDRFYPNRLPHPWGQFGPLGVSEASRGKRYGAAVIDAAARQLKAGGVRGCVIDWTTHLELYGKFGFQPYRAYTILTKTME